MISFSTPRLCTRPRFEAAEPNEKMPDRASTGLPSVCSATYRARAAEDHAGGLHGDAESVEQFHAGARDEIVERLASSSTSWMVTMLGWFSADQFSAHFTRPTI